VSEYSKSSALKSCHSRILEHLCRDKSFCWNNNWHYNFKYNVTSLWKDIKFQIVLITVVFFNVERAKKEKNMDGN
jgi:hypothetical protein